jgi:hypothetical protein
MIVEMQIDKPMKTIKEEEYSMLNQALYTLELIFERVGIREFKISAKTRDMHFEPNGQEIDTELLRSFCKNMEQLQSNTLNRRGNNARE